ncbi:peptidoglycan recognition protein family protein [Polynucleobacter sp.]|uniref:peptidoglycan recognition protein family protein n=1 Tax=Polynucleobacter sp. TaxID=2029855 RepID=UPI003F6A1125
MKTYPRTDVRGDTYLNPSWPQEKRAEGSVTRIIVHHDASIREHDYDSLARYRSEAQAHYQRLGPGLQYHIKIDNTGEVFLIRPFDQALYHAGDYNVNRTSIAICLDGYFHPPYNQMPTREQYEALKQTLDWLCTQNPQFPASQGDVYPHRAISSTACPGDTFYGWVDEYRATGGNPTIPNVPYDWPEWQASEPAPAPAPVPAPTPPAIEVNYRVMKDGKQIGAYKEEENAWNKYKAENASMILDGMGKDVTPRFIAKYVTPAPPDPVKPPTEDPADTTNPAGKPIEEAPAPSKPQNIFTALIELLKRLWAILTKKKG